MIDRIAIRERAHQPQLATSRRQAVALSPRQISPIPRRQSGCACGGECPRCEDASASTIQTKLRVSTPGDHYEQEADRVADQVMRMPEPYDAPVAAISSRAPATVPRKQMARNSTHDADDSVSHGDVLPGKGEPLVRSELEFFEPRFGRDFGVVRVHADNRAAQLAQALNARAYTVGRDIVFGAGEYSPGTTAGRLLLAHELTHVVQQHRHTAAQTQRGLTTPLNVSARLEAGLVSRQQACPEPPTHIGQRNRPEPCIVSGGMAMVPGVGVLFCRDSDLVRPDYQPVLSNPHALARGALRIQLHGYASLEGPSSEYNFNLSCQRSAAIQSRFRAAGVTIPIDVFEHGGTSLFGPPESDRVVVISKVMPPPRLPERRNEVPPRPGGDGGTPPGSDASRPQTSDAGPSQTVDAGPQPPSRRDIDAGLPPPAGDGVCGPNVTEQIGAAVANTVSVFTDWDDTHKQAACSRLISWDPTDWAAAWDILDLHTIAQAGRPPSSERDWEDYLGRYRPECAWPEGRGQCSGCDCSVQVGTGCHYAGSANYVIYGHMCRLCNGHYRRRGLDASHYTEESMLDLIRRYKSDSPNYQPSRHWAQAGYRGWQTGSGPAGDRPWCYPGCSRPWVGPAFQVHFGWWII